MHLSMVGTGYVGLVTGVCLANTGNEVFCLDTDSAKIDLLRRGKCPIYEPGLTELLERNIAAGRLKFTTDAMEAHRHADMIFICVGTPSDERGHTDLKYILAAADDVGHILKSLGPKQKPKVVVVKSTVPVGTTFLVRDRIRQTAGAEIPFEVADNPEFLKEGAAIDDFNKPDRVVVGVEKESVGELMRDLYDPFVRNGHPVHVMDVLSAEMVKYASNAMLACKISFINEIANLCEAYGANVSRVREGMCADRRIGNQFLYPGLGYGGSCFPKDTLALIKTGQDHGAPTRIVETVVAVNDQRKRAMARKVIQACGGSMRGKTAAILGLTFKPNTDDMRESPAITIIQALQDAGARIRAYDPEGMAQAREVLADVTYAESAYDCATGADVLTIVTEWDQFRALDFDRIHGLMRAPVVVDLRNIYRATDLEARGFRYNSVGRSTMADLADAPD